MKCLGGLLWVVYVVLTAQLLLVLAIIVLKARRVERIMRDRR